MQESGADPSTKHKRTGLEAFFASWGRVVLKLRWLMLLLTIGASVLAVVQITKHLYLDNSIEAFASKDAKPSQILEAFRDEFGRDDVYMVLIEGDVFSFKYLERVKKLEAELAAMNLTLDSLGERKADRDRRRSGKSDETLPRPKLPPPPPDAVSDAIDDEFGDTDFADEFGEDDFGEDDFGEVDDAWKDEEGGSIVEEVISIITVRRTEGTPTGDLEVGELMDPMPANEAELAALKEAVLGSAKKGIAPDRALVGQVVSADGRFSAIIVRTAFMNEEDSQAVFDEVQRIASEHEAEGFTLLVSGLPAIGATLNRLMLSDMRLMFAISLGVLLLVLGVMFRHPLGAISPIIVVLLSGLWAVSITATMGYPITMLTNILPAFIICVGVADSVHLMSVYRGYRKRGLENEDAIVEALASTGPPVFFTSLTTATGLMSFVLAEVTGIGQMGVTGAIAVGFACLNTIVILPVLLSLNRKSLFGIKADPTHRDMIDRFLGACISISAGPRKRSVNTLLVALLFGLVAAASASQVRVWHNPLAWVPDGEPIKEAVDTADEHLGGTASVQLLIDGVTHHGVKDRELLAGLARLDDHIRDYVHPDTDEKIVGNTISLVDIVRETYRALNGGDQAFYRIPEEQAVLSQVLVAFENSDPDELKRMMTIDATRTQMTIRLDWMDATSYAPLSKHIEEGIEKYIPEAHGEIQTTGSVYLLLSTVGSLLMDLVKSFGFAFVLISMLMIFMLRSVKLGLIAMVPNLLPIIFILGFMGIADIPIDMANMMIASIALGIAVDDTIHFLHQFKVQYDQTGDVEGSIAYTIDHSGRALVVTSVILSCGFFVYMGASMISIQRFGLLIGATVIMALVLDVILTPALIRLTFKDRASTPSTPQETAA